MNLFIAHRALIHFFKACWACFRLDACINQPWNCHDYRLAWLLDTHKFWLHALSLFHVKLQNVSASFEAVGHGHAKVKHYQLKAWFFIFLALHVELKGLLSVDCRGDIEASLFEESLKDWELENSSFAMRTLGFISSMMREASWCFSSSCGPWLHPQIDCWEGHWIFLSFFWAAAKSWSSFALPLNFSFFRV